MVYPVPLPRGRYIPRKSPHTEIESKHTYRNRTYMPEPALAARLYIDQTDRMKTSKIEFPLRNKNPRVPRFATKSSSAAPRAAATDIVPPPFATAAMYVSLRPSRSSTLGGSQCFGAFPHLHPPANLYLTTRTKQQQTFKLKEEKRNKPTSLLLVVLSHHRCDKRGPSDTTQLN